MYLEEQLDCILSSSQVYVLCVPIYQIFLFYLTYLFISAVKLFKSAGPEDTKVFVTLVPAVLLVVTHQRIGHLPVLRPAREQGRKWRGWKRARAGVFCAAIAFVPVGQESMCKMARRASDITISLRTVCCWTIQSRKMDSLNSFVDRIKTACCFSFVFSLADNHKRV
jgi:hypothetical protein